MTAADAVSRPAEAPRVTLRHRVEYAAIRAFAGFVGLIPFPAAAALARGLANLYAIADRRHRQIAERNLSERLGMDAAAASRTARETFRHVFTSAVESFHLDREIARRGLAEVIEIEGGEHVDAALRAGQGVIFASLHQGNWEIVPRAATARGWPLTTVYRALDNPLLDRWLLSLRTGHGQEMVEKHGALKPLIRALRGNRVVVLLVDQDAGRHGVFAPFLGKLASTIPTPAELALRTGAAIIPTLPLRTGPGFRHRMRLEAPLEVCATGDHDADVLRITSALNARLEAAVRSAPEQWLWAHRRWKTAPPAAGSATAGPDGPRTA